MAYVYTPDEADVPKPSSYGHARQKINNAALV